MSKKARALGVFLALLLALPVVSCDFGDRGQSGSDTGSESPVRTQEPTDSGANETKIEPIPDVPDAGDAMKITAEELLKRIRNGEIAEKGNYALTGTEYLIFDSTDNRKTYDLRGATIRVATRDGESAVTLKSVRNLTLQNCNLVVTGDTALKTVGARECTLTGIHISGEAKTGFALDGKVNTLDGGTVSGSYGTAVLASGESIGVTNCTLEGATVGIRDESADGCVAENNILKACKIGIETAVPNTVIWYNTITGGDCGIKASFKKSEISAGEGDGYNILAAKNKITNAKTSILYENVSNGVILLNEAETVTASGCTYLYANENKVTAFLVLKKNNYMIANGNRVGNLTDDGNQNKNGDNVTKLDERPEAGVNEVLQPHINSEQFVGMKRKAVVRGISESKQLNEYLLERMVDDATVIVPPGAYIGDEVALEGVKNVTVYAYGVLDEQPTLNTSCTRFLNCEDITLKGITFTYAIYPHIQGTILKVNGSDVEFLPDPGYNNVVSGMPTGNYFRPGEKTTVCDFPSFSRSTYNSQTGTNTIYGAMHADKPGMASAGYRIALRGDSGFAMYMKYCSGFQIEDVTVLSCGTFSEFDVDNEVAPVFHRYAVVYGPAPVLDSGKDYSRYNRYAEIVTTDSYGRKRSASPMYTTCDATHSTNSRVGSRTISCLLEGMNDDGGNINAYYGLASGFDSATKTLTYTTCDVRGYQLLPGAFRVGDEVLLFDWNGKFLAQTMVTEATKDVGNQEYTIKLKENVTLPSGIKVVVQNLDASGKGFLWDNVTVRTNQANGVRAKASGGKIVNCFFDNVRHCGVSVVPEWQEWPEVGFASDLEILNCVFDGNSRSAAMWDDWNYWAMGASIQFAGGTGSSDVDYCLHRNIRISGNVFRNRYSRYQISLSAVHNLELTNNRFEAPRADASLNPDGAPILIRGGNGIVISGNSYSSEVRYPIENRDNAGANITGDDIEN